MQAEGGAESEPVGCQCAATPGGSESCGKPSAPVKLPSGATGHYCPECAPVVIARNQRHLDIRNRRRLIR